MKLGINNIEYLIMEIETIAQNKMASEKGNLQFSIQTISFEATAT